MTAQVWHLYRIWSVDGRRMYVGRTSQNPPERRIVQHSTRAWWRYVDTTRTELEVLNRGQPITAAEAAEIERREIQRDGGTLANNEWNGGRGTLFEAFIQSGGDLAGWRPDDIPVHDLPDPWSGPAGDLSVAALVAVGLLATSAAVIAAIIDFIN